MASISSVQGQFFIYAISPAQAIATSLFQYSRYTLVPGYPQTQLSIWINDDHFVLQTAHTTELSHPKYIWGDTLMGTSEF